MGRYLLGQPIRVETTVKDLTGALVTPDTIALTLLPPDGTPVLGPTPTADSVGRYHVDLVGLSQLGHYQYKWMTTGPGSGVSTSSFDVTDPFEPELLSLADAKDHLNIDQSNTKFDAELGTYLDAVRPVVEEYVGPLYEQRVDTVLGGAVLVLPVAPVRSVSSITIGGAVVDLNTITLDKDAGLIRYAAGYGYPTSFPSAVVAYTAGRSIIPATLNLAAKVIVAHWWETQRSRGTGVLSRGDAVADYQLTPQMGFAVPNRAVTLMQPFVVKTGLH